MKAVGMDQKKHRKADAVILYNRPSLRLSAFIPTLRQKTSPGDGASWTSITYGVSLCSICNAACAAYSVVNVTNPPERGSPSPLVITTGTKFPA
eukprot:scaffold4587_cov182-Amphora_coffeaeformis.AAC.2